VSPARKEIQVERAARKTKPLWESSGYAVTVATYVALLLALSGPSGFAWAMLLAIPATVGVMTSMLLLYSGLRALFNVLTR
jgi:hypothetical protein